MPIKIRVSQEKKHSGEVDNWKMNGGGEVKRTMEVEMYNDETNKWEILLGKDAFEEEEVEEAIRDKDLAWLVSGRGAEVFEYMEGDGDFFELLCETEMNEYIDSKIEYDKFEFKEDK